MSNHKQVLAALLCLALLVLPLTGCGTGDSSGEPGPEVQSTGDISVTDMSGRTVSLATPATRVVALMPADCEIIWALEAGELLVGRGEYCDWPAQVLELPPVQSGSQTNLEEILALEADLVIMSSMAQSLDQVEALQAAGVPVFISDAQEIAGVYQAIALIGTLLDREAQAEALVAEMQEGFRQIALQVPDGEPLTVYFEASPLEYGLWAAGSGTFMDEIAILLNLENIFSDVQGWAEVSEEQVIDRNPDIIITTSMYFGDGRTPDEEVLARSGWGKVSAVADGRVFQSGADEITRPGPRLVQAAQDLYRLVYPA